MCFSAALLAFVAVALVPGEAGRQRSASEVNANPIRKVVTMLQQMQKKVQEEAKREEDLYEKFMCYCKSGNGDLTASISGAETKVPAVQSDIEESEGKLTQTKATLKKAQQDRSAAKDAMAEATSLREKEAAAYAAEKADYDANIGAINQAVAALDKGMAGSFLQTKGATILRQLALGRHEMLDVDRQALVAFLSSKQEASYVPRSGEISGILKEMGETMEKSLAEITSSEQAAVKSYEGIMAAKTKEVQALVASVEAKTSQVGELGMAIVHMKADLSDTEAALIEDQKFIAELQKSCSSKTAEWEERQKTRADELVALAETIKVLNEDDALELFKKTLPSAASASFVQVGVHASALRTRALGVVREARRAASEQDRVAFDQLALALTGRKALTSGGFDKVIRMCDDMVQVLKKEQDDDNHKKEFCGKQLDLADDKKKTLEHFVSDEELAIEKAKEGIAALEDEISAIEAGIKAMDKQVAQATEQRKDEHAEFQELMASNTAAKQLLEFAKNRLNKFYNPKLYQPEPKTEGADSAPVLLEVSTHRQRRDASAPPPETWSAYAKKSQETTGVIAMLDLLVKDLDKEMTEAETEERGAQKEYEGTMQDSAEKRATDSKSLSDKLSAKADTEAALEEHKSAKESGGKELMATLKYIKSLHADCDWLLQYFDVRKEARAGEVDSLRRAKAILSGADYAFLQTRARGLLRGSP
eukprot:CAMPEP_0171168296 /NCGR_PEP_ID=MMETSP0790-20130122/7638_1 /TAXON_ID=2925 /ORGANISM="Alexandrium catenella, Strain OF101" /LENGTH=707 /DNA_ID=CAMNT_0011633133 /DNA_START=59 /DNA_END=2182 /DNA_ORIENTATION=-